MRKIIDAHLHLFPPGPETDAMAARVGHENSIAHLHAVFGQLNVAHGVVMSNRTLDPAAHCYPPELFHYCVGLDSFYHGKQGFPDDLPDLVEENLKRDNCCGVKLYPGYVKLWLTDPVYQPIFQLAARYDKPVAVHMGLTSRPRGHLKYSHPLALDEPAADHPNTRFVMCHLGNPFLEAAAAVLEKNPNVSADLSGLLEGRVDLDRYFRERGDYAALLRTWLNYVGCWDRVMYGTDWPIVNLEEYIAYIARIVPEAHHQAVFFDNANRIYGLGLPPAGE